MSTRVHEPAVVVPSTDQEVIDGYLQGATQSHDLIDAWICEVIKTRSWSRDLSPDDILSDTKVKLLTNLRAGCFKHESSLKTYIQKIARYTLIDVVRAERRVRLYLQSARYIDTTTDPSPHEIIEHQEEMVIYQRIFSLISEQCQQLWTMMFQDRMKYQAIAQQLGINHGTVKVRVFRCKEEAIALRKKLT